MVNALLIICNKIWRTGGWPTPWTQSLVIALPKNGNLQLCQNYHTISLISHPSKVMLEIILNRLKPEAEKIIAEEQAGFRPGRSTTEQIFNLRILCERYLQHQSGPLSCLHLLQKGIRQGVTRSTLGNYEVVQYQYKPYQRDSESLWQGHQCSLLQWQHRRLVQNYSRSKTGMSALTHRLQHIPGENHGWCTWRSQIDSQHWREDNLKLTFCWWHKRPDRLGIRVS